MPLRALACPVQAHVREYGRATVRRTAKLTTCIPVRLATPGTTRCVVAFPDELHMVEICSGRGGAKHQSVMLKVDSCRTWLSPVAPQLSQGRCTCWPPRYVRYVKISQQTTNPAPNRIVYRQSRRQRVLLWLKPSRSNGWLYGGHFPGLRQLRADAIRLVASLGYHVP